MANTRVEWVILDTIDNATIIANLAQGEVLASNTSVQANSQPAPNTNVTNRTSLFARVTAITNAVMVAVGNNTIIDDTNAVLVGSGKTVTFKTGTGNTVFVKESSWDF